MQSLEVTDLRITIGGREIVKGSTFSVGPGQRVSLLGESGSGKSLTAAAVLGRLPANAKTSGSIKVNGNEVLNVPAPKRRGSARVAMVFQDSAVALNPLVRLRDQIMEPLCTHRCLSKSDAMGACIDLADSVGLPEPDTILDRFPAELSGGQRQRVCIALALACDTKLMVADEPTTALDVVTQKRVLDVLKKYTAGQETPALLFITHDFAVASELCSDAVVMKDGNIVEQGEVAAIFASPDNPYTRKLVAAAHAATVDPYVQKFKKELAALRNEAAAAPSSATFYDIAEVSRHYDMPRKNIFQKRVKKTALTTTSLKIDKGERVGIVGVSGSGKTTLLKLMLALEGADSGSIMCDGQEVYPTSLKQLKWYRRKVQYVPQDPASTLDPLQTVRALVKEPLVRLNVPGDHDQLVQDALNSVGLDSKFLKRRANELSGGQAQRLAIARAIATQPEFLLADEPVSGLDLPMREQIVGLLKKVSEERGSGIAVVSHDLSMVASLCERTVVMHAGEVVEDRPTKELLTDPQHPRTQELLEAIPALDLATSARESR